MLSAFGEKLQKIFVNYKILNQLAYFGFCSKFSVFAFECVCVYVAKKRSKKLTFLWKIGKQVHVATNVFQPAAINPPNKSNSLIFDLNLTFLRGSRHSLNQKD